MHSELPHVPVWCELTTPDLAAAEDFYRQLFGWSFQQQNHPQAHAQHRLVITVEAAGAAHRLGTLSPVTPGGQAAFLPVFGTPDVAASLAAAEAAGAKVISPVQEVAEGILSAEIADPAGARCVLQEGGLAEHTSLGAQPGTLAWAECLSTDFDAALEFYIEGLGWDAHELTHDSALRYVTHGAGDAAVSGLVDISSVARPQAASRWLCYVVVADCDVACQQVQELGGKVISSAQETVLGRIATVSDPAGACFAVMS